MTAPARRLRALVIVAAAAAARWAAAGPLAAEPPVSVIELAAGSSGSGAIVLRNTGTAQITGALAAAPGCDPAVHTSPLGSFMLAAGATLPLTVACSPSPAGMRRCGYQVRSPTEQLLVELEAVCAYGGEPSLEPDAGALDFGSVVVGGTASRTITLRNTGAAAIDHLFVETTDLAGNFAVAAPCNPDARECDAAIPVLAPGATAPLVVTCTPRTVEIHTAELHIATSAGTRLAQPIALTCTGNQASAPVLSVTPGALDAGAVELTGPGQTVTLHLRNVGIGMLRLTALQLLDGGTGAAADWTIAPRTPCASSVPPTCTLTDQTADVDLAFTPRALGARDATLLVDFRDTADRSISIPLRGVGAGPTLGVSGSPAAINFGTLPVGAAGAVAIRAVNHGSRTLGDGAATLTPAGPPFSVSPAAGFTVTTAAATPIIATCTPTSAGKFTATLQLSAPDVPGPPIEIALQCAADPAQTLVATPPALLLGEVRTATPLAARFDVEAVAAPPIPLTSVELDPPLAGLTVSGIPATTPASLELTAAPGGDGSLDHSILVEHGGGGSPLAIAVTGTAVTPRYSAPLAVSLGTFCVQQPTTPRILELTSLGTATIGLSAPALQSPDSPFDLARVAPLDYPGPLAAGQRALIAITPKRRGTRADVSDSVVWATDVPGATTARTALSATFLDDGGAIAPGALAFGATQIRVDTRNAQQLTLQNCSTAALRFDSPQVPAPFAIDTPSFPASLNPREIATFSVGFHPTQTGKVNKTLQITSPQLRIPLAVELSGEGIAPGPGSDGGVPLTGVDTTSFYACSCTAGDPSAALAIALAALAVLAPRRRRGRVKSGRAVVLSLAARCWQLCASASARVELPGDDVDGARGRPAVRVDVRDLHR
jgi:MYXO-CTERM domain-containing protein